jgi:hypothetical protein
MTSGRGRNMAAMVRRSAISALSALLAGTVCGPIVPVDDDVADEDESGGNGTTTAPAPMPTTRPSEGDGDSDGNDAPCDPEDDCAHDSHCAAGQTCLDCTCFGEGGACGPEDECAQDHDCDFRQTCLSNCTCFGGDDPTDTQGTTCDDEPTCIDCSTCASMGPCLAEIQACETNPACIDLIWCFDANMCEEPACFQMCFDTYPDGQRDFINMMECTFDECYGSCDPPPFP